MGEAKKRGSFEQRKVVAIKRNTEILEKQRLAQTEKRQFGALLPIVYSMEIASGTLMPYTFKKATIWKN